MSAHPPTDELLDQYLQDARGAWHIWHAYWHERVTVDSVLNNLAEGARARIRHSAYRYATRVLAALEDEALAPQVSVYHQAFGAVPDGDRHLVERLLERWLVTQSGGTP